MANRYADQLVDSKTLSKDEERDLINQVADEHKLTGPDRQLLHAIRHAENGPKGTEFGILNSPDLPQNPERYKNDPDPSKSFKLQATYAAHSIKLHYKGDLAGIGKRFAPVEGATNDIHHKNKNWIPNVQDYMTKHTADGEELDVTGS